ncbi:helix-turn-helix domain-containing protein [Sorangium sp. So ce145]|uniref:helix-turn-helix domain-containing protein n=1 Tax=Sorangium sp. So ce145 TaxID=3133285 RepID=UPI003F61D19F
MAQGQGAGRGTGYPGAPRTNPGPPWGRGRRHGPGDRQGTLELIKEAVRGGATLEAACRALGLSARTVARWRRDAGGEDGAEPDRATRRCTS